MLQCELNLKYYAISNPEAFNLYGGAEPQGCIPVARGTSVHISVQESDRSIFITSGGTPKLCWRNPRAPGNPG